MADDATASEHLANGWHYHVSLSPWVVDEGAWNRIVERWGGAEITIEIQYVNDNGDVVLAWAGLGADPDRWEIYMSGSYAHKWQNGYGLHITM